MPDYSKLSDEELMSRINSIGTTSNTSSQDVSKLSDDELLSKISQFETPETPKYEQYLQSQQNVQSGSAVSIPEKLYLELFADDKGKEEYLKQKFPVVMRDQSGLLMAGDSPKSIKYYDVPGFFGDIPGELAQLVSIAPEAIGGTAGAIAGAPLGPVGAIGGAMAGSGAARAATIGAGKFLGVNEQTPQEMAVDTAISTIGGGAGEALNLALKATGPMMKQKSVQILKNIVDIQPESRKDFVRGGLAKIMSATAGLDPDAALRAIKRPNEVLAKGADSEQALVGILDSFQNRVYDAEEQYGQMVKKARAELSAYRPAIDMSPSQKTIMSVLNEVGGLNADGTINLDATGPVKRLQLNLSKVFKQLGGDIETTRLNTGKRIYRLRPNQTGKKVEDLFKIENQLDSIYESFKADPNLQRLIRVVRDGDSKLQAPGIKTVFNEVADKLGSRAFKDANAVYSNLMSITDQLGSYGIRKNNRLSIENAIKGSLDVPTSIKESMVNLDNLLKTNFMDKMMDYSAARAFSNANPNMIRFNTVSSWLGAALGTNFALSQDPASKLLSVIAAVGIGTPAGLRVALRAGTKLGKNISGFTRASSKGLGRLRPDARTTLQILQSASSAQARNNGRDNTNKNVK